MRFSRLLCFLIGLWTPFIGMGQKIAAISFDEVVSSEFGYPISLDLNSITHLPDSSLVLMDVTSGKSTQVPFQVDNLNGRYIFWMIEPQANKAKSSHLFELHRTVEKEKHNVFLALKATESSLIIQKNGADLWQYNQGIAYPPEGVDSAYARSGFIHPMWTPDGKSLTRIQPNDHYHHYGLWNPWTRATYKNELIDFWNLMERQGTVRFANFINRTSGPVFADYKALHEHVVLKDRKVPEIAMTEVQGTRIYALEKDNDYYLADISIVLNTTPDEPVVLEEYRYGSLGWRATEKWNRNNSEVITSEGLDRKSADGSLARWCIVQGELDGDYGAVVMMSYPANFNHPEPLRIWPEDIYDRGDMYANFAPTKNMAWKLEPSKSYQLNYRFLVSSKKISPEQAEAAWMQFAHKPIITINKF
ncbi:DUF6807 domain-containing protein [Cyclobacterium qasimii]|uniref:Methane oxygenase PmoA n=2 Tax=Cyclobacterium qasimii TaxID=1350429 RepID=S7V9L3_9BACT|nr:PmoA family protein [Cyclobacterium qasimii]EPR66955.1 hypothetical protein ADICYQ_4031 [Cyclobacterium qasimii M12-11B]